MKLSPNAENYLGFRIEQACDGRFYVRLGEDEIGSSVSMRLARKYVDEFLLNEDCKCNEWEEMSQVQKDEYIGIIPPEKETL